MLKKRVFINFFVICVFLFNSIGCSFAEVKTGDQEMNMPEQDYLIKEAIVPQIPQYPDLNEDTAMDEETEAQFNSWWDAMADRQSILIPDEDRPEGNDTSLYGMTYGCLLGDVEDIIIDVIITIQRNKMFSIVPGQFNGTGEWR